MFIERLTREDIYKFVELLNKEYPENNLKCYSIIKNKSNLIVNIKNNTENTCSISKNFRFILTDFCLYTNIEVSQIFEEKFCKSWLKYLHNKFQDEYINEAFIKIVKTQREKISEENTKA